MQSPVFVFSKTPAASTTNLVYILFIRLPPNSFRVVVRSQRPRKVNRNQEGKQIEAPEQHVGQSEDLPEGDPGTFPGWNTADAFESRVKVPEVFGEIHPYPLRYGEQPSRVI